MWGMTIIALDVHDEGQFRSGQLSLANTRFSLYYRSDSISLQGSNIEMAVRWALFLCEKLSLNIKDIAVKIFCSMCNYIVSYPWETFPKNRPACFRADILILEADKGSTTWAQFYGISQRFSTIFGWAVCLINPFPICLYSPALYAGFLLKHSLDIKRIASLVFQLWPNTSLTKSGQPETHLLRMNFFVYIFWEALGALWKSTEG